MIDRFMDRAGPFTFFVIFSAVLFGIILLDQYSMDRDRKEREAMTRNHTSEISLLQAQINTLKEIGIEVHIVVSEGKPIFVQEKGEWK